METQILQLFVKITGLIQHKLFNFTGL